MNRAYRLVWNETNATWVAVAETATARGKGNSRSARAAILAALIASGLVAVPAGAEQAATTVVPASGRTNAYISANGVPVVNIETANASGLSHNRFTRYDVEAIGMVLNNGNNSQVARQSQLAGQVISNLNLVQEARVILNEVVSTNRSTLAGFTEVLGGKADVIVANPNGITCNGCGFINTDRATLTTGTPNVAGDGSLSGFTVNRGDVLIQGQGANASTQQVFDLVARSVKVDGAINTPADGSLAIVAGNNTYDYANRTVTSTGSGSGPAPAFAVDSTALGGMYAGRIRIIATEAGVGVRMLGEAAASADDFTLTSAGKIELQSAVSARRDASISTTSATGSQDLFVNGAGAKVSAERDLSLSATTGQVRLAEGELYAANNLSLTSATMTDVSTTAKTRYAGVNQTVSTSGAANIDGGVWGAGSALSGSFDSLTVGSGGAKIYAGTTLGLTTVNNLSLNTAGLRSTGNMTLTATNGAISMAAGAAQGVQTTHGNLSLTAGNGFTNAGTVTADLGSVTARVNGTLSNSGTLNAKTTLDLADKNNGSTVNVTNTGTVIADGSITAKAASFTNQASGRIQGTTGTTLNATSLTNAGTFIASNTSTQSGTFTLASLNNSGTLQSAKDLTFNVTGTLANSGRLLATDSLSVQAGSAALAITNTSPGVIQAGNGLTLNGSNATFNTQSGTVLGNTVGATLSSLTNSGTFQSNAGMTLAVGNGLTNTGTLLAKTTLSSSSGSLTNSGTLQADQGSTINASGALANSGMLIASGSASQGGTITAGTVSNTSAGTIQSAQNLTVNVSGATLTNAGRFLASNHLTVSSTGSGLNLTNQSGGYLQAGTASGSTLTIGGTSVALNNNAGGTLFGDRLAFTLASLTNGGSVQGGAAASTISVSGTVANTGTLALANQAAGSGTITADTITNSGTLQSSGAAALNVASQLSNSGNVLTGGALTVRGTDSAYDVTGAGRIQAGGLLDIKGQSGGNGVNLSVDSAGVLLGDSMDLNAGTLTVANNGMVSSSGNMTVAATTLSFGGSSSRIVAATSGSGTASIALTNGFTNPGALHSGGTLSFSAPTITNSSTGGFSALGTLSLSATGGNLYNAGALYAGSQLNASATGTLTNAANTGTIDSSGSMSLSAASFVNNNHLRATSNIAISATTFRNETPGGDTRQWTAISWGGNQHDRTDSWYDFPDDYERQYWYKTGTQTQYYAGGTPSYNPQIIAGGTLSISGFSSGYNIGGVLSGQTVNLTGNGGATFLNDDLALHRKNWKQTWEVYTHWIALGPATYDDHVTQNLSSPFVTSQPVISTIGAGIYAGTLNASGFSLTNAGSPQSASASATSQTGASGTSLSGSATATSSGTGVTGTTTVSGAPAISFGGLVIALPTNPNGYFVVSQNPSAQYLVETNPLFNVGMNFVGSDYMANRYGYNPDTIIKRLGDSNYEAYLIRQQLVNQTGRNILTGYANEADQMKGLWDQAVTEGKRLGLTFGKPLSESQIANLKEDVVWMVETTVAGQKVLAPVVYLAASTKSGIDKGAVIAGENVNMNLNSVTNTGGTISGSKTLNITSKGDITNTSGTIKGGDVTLKSTEGSIKNQTLVEGGGGSKEYVTTIGKTAGITATGNLDMSAGKDITVKGGDVKAGGNASLDAGGNISFETVVNKTTTTTSSSSRNGLQSSVEATTTTTEKNIGSTLQSGGNLTLKSGGDTTIKGSTVKSGGDLNVDTGGDFKVLSVQDKTTTHTEKNTSGLGVGGGLVGSEKVTTDDFQGKNVGSTVTVGGNAKVKSAGEMTLQGSDMSVAGNADIDAKKGINVLDGLDERRTTTKTETTTFLKMESGGESGSGTESGSQTQSGKTYGKAGGGAKAEANASGTADFKFSESTTTVTKSGSNTSVGSNLKVGGNLNLTSEGTVKVQGSNVEAGGDLGVNAKNVEVTTGRNESWSDTTTDRVSTGIFNEGKSGAQAGAEGQAKGGTIGNSATGNAGASAGADGTTTIGVRVENEKSSSYTLTNTGSTLKSGGNMNIKAKNDVTFVGSSAESGGDMNIDAKNITNKAAQDITLNTDSKTRHTAGLYVDGQAGAEANATGQAGRLGNDPVSGEAKAGASADASAGVRYKNEQSSSTEGTVTQVTSSFKSGGNFTRKATDTITDQGTQIEAGGNITQTAREIREIEAKDSTFSNKQASSHDAKIGVGADASAGAGANSKGETEADAGAGAGFRAKYKGEITGESEGSTTAVTTRYKAGGNINSTSTEKTTLIGTQMDAKGNVNIEAGSLDFKAASDTTNSSGTSHEIDAKLKVDVVGSKGGSLEASYQGGNESEKSSTARTGSINAGGKLNIKTKGDASFEGTQLESGGDASIKSGGSVDFKAARDTTESSSKSGGVSVELSGSKKSKSGGVSGEYAQENSASSTAQTSSIKSGGKLDISAGKDASFEGTQMKSTGDASVEAGGNVNLKAAKDTETGTAFGVSGGVGGGSEKEKGKKTDKQSGEFGASVEHTDKVQSTGTAIESGGTVSIKGKNVVNQEASVQGAGGTEVTGKVVNQKAENRDIAIGVDVGAVGEKEKETKTNTDSNPKPKPKPKTSTQTKSKQ